MHICVYIPLNPSEEQRRSDLRCILFHLLTASESLKCGLPLRTCRRFVRETFPFFSDALSLRRCIKDFFFPLQSLCIKGWMPTVTESQYDSETLRDRQWEREESHSISCCSRVASCIINVPPTASPSVNSGGFLPISQLAGEKKKSLPRVFVIVSWPSPRHSPSSRRN